MQVPGEIMCLANLSSDLKILSVFVMSFKISFTKDFISSSKMCISFKIFITGIYSFWSVSDKSLCIILLSLKNIAN